jgi:hypothetical protein
MNPFGVVEDDAIPGPRVILDDDEIGSDSPGKTSWVVIVATVVAVVEWWTMDGAGRHY